jgi:hypothetical protein
MEQSPGENKMLRVGVELVSPVFVYRNPEWISAFREVLETLNNSIRWKPNRSTGLHVHVALEHRPFTLEEIKSFAKNVLIFECITFECMPDDS